MSSAAWQWQCQRNNGESEMAARNGVSASRKWHGENQHQWRNNGNENNRKHQIMAAMKISAKMAIISNNQ
jgi:hypothetical protein